MSIAIIALKKGILVDVQGKLIFILETIIQEPPYQTQLCEMI